MLLTSGIDIPGKEIEVIDLVRGNVVRAKNFGSDFMAGLKNLAGGEIKSYTNLTNKAREIAKNRMIEKANELNADAIISIRFASASILEGTIEMLCYGTAVKFK